eukprot:CAMPEP_0184656244 /NCGR_PEP_ID=MMETSP0308-20130426/16098_1 /TAXON_ID=38269 /ORGANISM="Gloeochaete witrockiana, Strain SAG 46.84" /LENGTH=62 /DNA_ID=CAMNT_0027093269 /DNA_START=41 /DNA_END=229 /DNA_ORIENTATION=+
MEKDNAVHDKKECVGKEPKTHAAKNPTTEQDQSSHEKKADIRAGAASWNARPLDEAMLDSQK